MSGLARAYDIELCEAAHAWWQSRRPNGWTEAQHLEHPLVNTTSEAQNELATAVVQWLAELDGDRPIPTHCEFVCGAVTSAPWPCQRKVAVEGHRCWQHGNQLIPSNGISLIPSESGRSPAATANDLTSHGETPC